MAPNRIAMLVALLALAIPAIPVQARGEAGRRGAGAQAQSRQAPAARSGQPGQGAMAGRRDAQGNGLRDQATEQQRAQYLNCQKSLDGVRTDATELERLASAGSGFYLGRLRRQHKLLGEQMRAMEQENQRLVKSLNQQQKAAVRQHLRALRLIEEHSHTRLRAIDRELAKPSPSSTQIAGTARVLEEQINHWAVQHREMAGRLGLAGGPAMEK
jgi:hypothetical protein